METSIKETTRNDKKIIDNEFSIPSPEKRAALKLFQAGIKEQDLMNKGLEDTKRILVQNELRDLKKNTM